MVKPQNVASFHYKYFEKSLLERFCICYFFILTFHAYQGKANSRKKGKEVRSRAFRKQSPSKSSQISDSVVTDISYQKELIEDPFIAFCEMMNCVYAREGQYHCHIDRE